MSSQMGQIRFAATIHTHSHSPIDDDGIPRETCSEGRIKWLFIPTWTNKYFYVILLKCKTDS